MSREETAAVLRNLQLSLDGLQREVEGALRRLPDTRREALPALLADCRRRLAALGVEQLQEIDAFAAEAGLQLGEPGRAAEDALAAALAAGSLGAPDGHGSGGGDGASGGTPTAGAGHLRSLERRVASMGGIPALGACVLPRMTPGERPTLAATASPAAVEIMRGRLGGSDADATPLRKVGGGVGDGDATPVPMVQLRATPATGRPAPAAGTPGGGGGGGGDAMVSELEVAMQQRAARLSMGAGGGGGISPDKQAATAAGGS